jgi:hypothetical protein
MPTPLHKPVRRAVQSARHGPLVVTAAAEGLYLRERGRRTTYGPIGWGQLFQLGVQQYVLEQRRLKAAAKRARREGLA